MYFASRRVTTVAARRMKINGLRNCRTNGTRAEGGGSSSNRLGPCTLKPADASAPVSPRGPVPSRRSTSDTPNACRASRDCQGSSERLIGRSCIGGSDITLQCSLLRNRSPSIPRSLHGKALPASPAPRCTAAILTYPVHAGKSRKSLYLRTWSTGPGPSQDQDSTYGFEESHRDRRREHSCVDHLPGSRSEPTRGARQHPLQRHRHHT